MKYKYFAAICAASFFWLIVLGAVFYPALVIALLGLLMTVLFWYAGMVIWEITFDED